ncbi:MAG: glutamine synthetase [Candidatus Tokpelaia sp. JSC161]|jgi:glutamine synthetase|nr:MAG: glutamine synthetase [Candidatus Tokpelaia sp. JSC161]
MMTTINSLLKKIQDHNIRFVDLRFTDQGGKLHHITVDSALVHEDIFSDGVMFDASSNAGWKAVNESDMILMPDPRTEHIDPFFAEMTMVIMCDILDPMTGSQYNRDPRSIARKCEDYVCSLGFSDTIYIGPEAEFFIFDDVRFSTDPYQTGFRLDSNEFPLNDDKESQRGNLAHRPRIKGGYVPVPPMDSCQDMRSEILTMLKGVGIEVERHHHEVAAAQHEIGIKFDTLVRQADKMQVFKYVVHQVASAYGKTATFMPKPIYGDNGSGMHVHLSLWKESRPIFSGNEYAGLSEPCLYFIGGILKHAQALNAFTNPSTNSYKRLVPGFEAPVLLAYSARNRSASCRIPYGVSPGSRRVEVRFPDPSANPYLAFSALIMAGVDGIKNRIHPGSPMDKDLYDLSQKELVEIPTVSRSLRIALEALDKDRCFLKTGGVFDDEMLDSFISLKMQEILYYERMPHPVEFDMYYSV